MITAQDTVVLFSRFDNIDHTEQAVAERRALRQAQEAFAEQSTEELKERAAFFAKCAGSPLVETRPCIITEGK